MGEGSESRKVVKRASESTKLERKKSREWGGRKRGVEWVRDLPGWAYVENDVGVSAVELAIVRLWPFLHLKFLEQKSR